MGNMSYVRFQNTLEDLRSCQDHLWDKQLSEEEEQARQELIEVCREVAEEFPKSQPKRGE